MLEEESDIQARIEIAKKRRDKIGEPLGPRMTEHALSQPPVNPDKETTTAPSSEGTGKPPFILTAEGGILPVKDVSAEDRHKTRQRAKRTKRSSSTG